MLLRITALAAAASAMKPPSPAFRVTALAAVATATAPPFVTELRPAARRTQEEYPVLTKIKKDDCTDVKDFEALPVCSDSCLCKGMHCRAEPVEHCGSEDKGSGHHNCDAKSIYLVESALELPRFQCPPCPARNAKCPAIAPLKECLPGNPAATDCVPRRRGHRARRRRRVLICFPLLLLPLVYSIGGFPFLARSSRKIESQI